MTNQKANNETVAVVKPALSTHQEAFVVSNLWSLSLVSGGMKRDFPDYLPLLVFFAWRPNLRSHCRCQPDDRRAWNPSGDLIGLSPERFPAHILWQIIFNVFAKGNDTFDTCGVWGTFQCTGRGRLRNMQTGQKPSHRTSKSVFYCRFLPVFLPSTNPWH